MARSDYEDTNLNARMFNEAGFCLLWCIFAKHVARIMT